MNLSLNFQSSLILFCACSEEDSDYSIKIMNMIKLFGKPIRVNKASQDKKTLDVGANLFVGNLDPEIDEKVTFPLSFPLL